MSAEKANTAQAVIKAGQLLELLAQAKSPMALSELAQRTGWAKSTVHGLLSSMRPTALVEQTADGKYRLGIRMFEYGTVVSAGWDILTVAKPYVRALSEKIQETVVLATFDRDEVMVLYHDEPVQGVRIVTETGTHMPAFATAHGKALLAYRPLPTARRIFEERFTPYTPHTIDSFARFKAELAAISERGYAVENGEYRIGMRGAAAPIYDVYGEVRYTIGTLGMFRRVESEPFQTAVTLLLEAARSISAEMGYRE